MVTVLLTGVGEVDDQVPGTYTLTFDYNDTAGNTAATVTRTVVVEDTSAPVITLIGDTNVTHEAGSDYTDLGATWSDAVDGNGSYSYDWVERASIRWQGVVVSMV